MFDIKETTVRKVSIWIICCWLPAAVSFVVLLCIGPFMSTTWSAVFTPLFAITSFVFLVETTIMVVLHLFVLTVLISLFCVSIATEKLRRRVWSSKTLALALTALVGHVFFYIVMTLPTDWPR